VKLRYREGESNINLVPEAMLRNILNNMGVKIEFRDIVADSILDWLDPMDLYGRMAPRMTIIVPSKNRMLAGTAHGLGGEPSSSRGLLRRCSTGKKLQRGPRGAKVDQIGLKDIFSHLCSGRPHRHHSAAIPVLRGVLGIRGEFSQSWQGQGGEGCSKASRSSAKGARNGHFYGDNRAVDYVSSSNSLLQSESRAKTKGGRIRGAD